MHRELFREIEALYQKVGLLAQTDKPLLQKTEEAHRLLDELFVARASEYVEDEKFDALLISEFNQARIFLFGLNRSADAGAGSEFFELMMSLRSRLDLGPSATQPVLREFLNTRERELALMRKRLTALSDQNILRPDWSALPTPIDDGAANHLRGARIPAVSLAATDGTMVELSSVRGLVIVYAYPRTGVPGEENPPGWDQIPGARGCTPQTCAFRDHFAELRELGVDTLFGVSAQDTAYQTEAAKRLYLPFPLLSDANFALTDALNLPTFESNGMRLLKRLTLVIRDGTVEHVFYPVFPPDRNASDVVSWLKAKSPSRHS